MCSFWLGVFGLWVFALQRSLCSLCCRGGCSWGGLWSPGPSECQGWSPRASQDKCVDCKSIGFHTRSFIQSALKCHSCPLEHFPRGCWWWVCVTPERCPSSPAILGPWGGSPAEGAEWHRLWWQQQVWQCSILAPLGLPGEPHPGCPQSESRTAPKKPPSLLGLSPAQTWHFRAMLFACFCH